MKKFLCLLSGCALGISAQAQTYFSDDFSSGNLNNWTLVDSDGDGNDWYVLNFNDGIQNDHATSASYAGSALNPDNWMVSQAIDLTSATGTVFLTWKVYGQDQDWPAENYSVYVNTSSDVNTMITDGNAFTEVLTTSNGYMFRSIDISSHVGETVYIAFRHHNVSDEFRINLDDIEVMSVAANDLKVSNVLIDNSIEGDRTFQIIVTNNGTNPVSAFDLDWSFNGGSTTTVNPTGLNLEFGDSYTIEVPVNGTVAANNIPFVATITTSDDDDSNNSLTQNFNIVLPIRQYIATDSHGEDFNLYNSLSSGQAIILDFMASWCGPCESSTPEISAMIQNNGSGEGRVQALAISVEQTDNNSVLNNLDWNGGFYSYPKFAYTAENNAQYYHYGVNHDFNSGGSIPFFVMICPNVTDPGRSEIVKVDVGYGNGMFVAYQSALDACPSATLSIDINEEELETTLSVYPNPAKESATVSFNADAENTSVEVINSLGQTVYSVELGSVMGQNEVNIPTSELAEGLYFVNVKNSNGSTATARLSVVK